MTTRELDQARRLLCSLQEAIGSAVRHAQVRGSRRMTQVAAVTAADTIYQIDKVSETTVLAWFEKNWPRRWPVELVMEGIEEGHAVVFPREIPLKQTRFKCIIDPIDGTRGLMYDKRSAWSLAALAPQRGAETNLSDIVVAAMTELPVSKQSLVDQFSAVRGHGVKAVRFGSDLQRKKIKPRPSTATDLAHGFASFAKFFPQGKAMLAAEEEKLWRALDAGVEIFDDQYLSTGGQLHELFTGRDRFVADLRPLVLEKLRVTSSLVCHPYDMCTALIAQELGCIITAPDGRPLQSPLDTTSPVAWVGYANPALARWIGPKLKSVLR